MASADVEREAQLRELLLRKRKESAAASSAGACTTQGESSDAAPADSVAPSGEPKRRRKRWGDAKDESSVPPATERSRPSRWAKTVVAGQPGVLLPGPGPSTAAAGPPALDDKRSSSVHNAAAASAAAALSALQPTAAAVPAAAAAVVQATAASVQVQVTLFFSAVGDATVAAQLIAATPATEMGQVASSGHTGPASVNVPASPGCPAYNMYM